MNQTFQFADPRGAVVASLLFGGIAAFIGVAVATILRRLAAPADEPSYYGTTPGVRRAIGGAVALGLAAIFWFQFWGGFYRLTIAGRDVHLSYYGPTRGRSIGADGLQVSWIPAGKSQRALQLTTPDGATFTSQATSLSRAASVESGHQGRTIRPWLQS